MAEEPLRIYLDSFRKYRNANEYRTINRASCGDMSVSGDGHNIQKLCAILAENNPPSSMVEVWQGGTLCFAAAPLVKWASGSLGKEPQPDHLRADNAAPDT